MKRKDSMKLAIPTHSRGFSLLEVLLSLFILSFSMASLSYLAYVGLTASTRSKLQSEALWHAQSLLEEAVAGCRPVKSSTTQSIQEGSNWQYRITCRASETPQVFHYQVVVWQLGRWSKASQVSLERLAFHEERIQ